MSTALLSTTQRPIGTELNMPMERHARLSPRLLIVLVAVLVLHALTLVVLALMPPPPKRVPIAKPIAVRLISIVPDAPKPKPEPPKPVVKPKLVPIVKDLPKPKPLPILVAPKSAPSPVVVAPVEKVIDKTPPTPVVAESKPEPVEVRPAKPEPVQPKLIEGVSFIRKPAPVIPDSAKRDAFEGTTIVHILVSVDGMVQTATVKKSSGSAELDRVAVSAVKKSLLKPYRENGVAIPIEANVPIEFSIGD